MEEEFNYRLLPKTLKKYDKESNIWRHVNNLNLLANNNFHSDTKALNSFVNGLRALQANLHSHITEDAQQQLDELTRQYKTKHNIQDKINIIFQKYDLLFDVIDNKFTLQEYETVEQIIDDDGPDDDEDKPEETND